MRLDAEFIVYCSQCRELVKLSSNGECPVCKAVADAYPAYLLAYMEMDARNSELCQKYPSFIFKAYQVRGAAEYGITTEEIYFLATRMIKFPHKIGEAFGAEIFIPEGLPRLDVVVQTFKHSETGEITGVYQEPYCRNLYQLSVKGFPFYSLNQVLYEMPDSPVFPRSAEDGLTVPKYYELAPSLFARQYLNSLWNALFLQGFYLIPEDWTDDENL